MGLRGETKAPAGQEVTEAGLMAVPSSQLPSLPPSPPTHRNHFPPGARPAALAK